MHGQKLSMTIRMEFASNIMHGNFLNIVIGKKGNLRKQNRIPMNCTEV
jgi:hypothetical protein